MIADESVEALPIGEPNKWQESGDTATAPGRTEWMDAVAWEQLVTISDFWKSPISSAFSMLRYHRKWRLQNPPVSHHPDRPHERRNIVALKIDVG